MKRKTWYFLHKWIAIIVGVFFLLWTITGIVMMLPSSWFGPNNLESPEQPDYRTAILSPAEIISELENALGSSIKVSWTGLKQIGGTVVYETHLVNGRVYLLDAATGEIVEITPEVAEALARERLSLAGEGSSPPKLMEIERLNSHDLMYPFGNLPVYRVQFEGDGSNLYYVSANAGTVSQSNQLTRIRGAITSLHTFEPVRLFTDSSAVRKGLLILFSSIGVAAALTGYYLALLPYFSRRTKSKKSRTVSAPLDGTSSS